MSKVFKYLSVNDVARLLNVHHNTVRNWDAKGLLKPVMRDQFDKRYYTKKQLDQFVKNKLPNIKLKHWRQSGFVYR